MRWVGPVAVCAAVVGAVYVAAVARLFRPTSGAASRGRAASPATQADGPAPPADPSADLAPAATGGAPSAVGAPPGPRHGPRRASKSLRKVASARFLGGMNELTGRLEDCPGRHAAAGGFGGKEAQGPQPEDVSMLMLDVATHDGSMEILDVSLPPNGSHGAAFGACAQRVLRGQVVSAPYPAGRRMQYPLWLPP